MTVLQLPTVIDTPVPALTGRHGALHMTFVRQRTRTALVHSYWRPPLQIMRTIEDEAGVRCVYLLSPTGGIVQGDDYDVQINVAAGAHALLTTQAATKVFRMPDRPATQRTVIDVQPGAVFEYVPDAQILFAQSDLRQEFEITVHRGGLLLLHDIVMPGRLARGEVLEFTNFASKIVARDEDGLLLYDAMRCRPDQGNVLDLGLLEDHPCWGSWYLLGDLTAWNINAADFCTRHQDTFARPGAFGSISPLARNGIAARMVAQRLSPIYAAFEDLRAVVRNRHLHRPTTALRK
ncbi:MAG: urease accessory protein UreD [Caldilineaceae bacterium]